MLIGDAGHGVLGSEVPSTGDDGPGYLYNDLVLPADANKEVRGQITTVPLHGTLIAYEDSSFLYTPNTDYVGTDSFAYQLYVDGVATGSPTTVTLTVVGNTHYITASEALQSNAASPVALGQTKNVIPVNLVQSNAVSPVVIKQSHVVTTVSVVQANTVSPAYVGQTDVHLVVPVNTVQPTLVSDVSVGQTHLVTLPDVTQVVSVSGVSVGFSDMTLTPADIQAIVAALQAAILPVNIVQVNYGPVDGDGSDSNPWGPV